jgi:hypothetical protein
MAGGSTVYNPVGLDSWELVAVSAGFAAAVVAVAFVIGAALAQLILRDPAPIRLPAAERAEMPQAQSRPETRPEPAPAQPVFASAKTAVVG